VRHRSQLSQAPSWFTAALEHKPEHVDIEVDGCRIHVRAWGNDSQAPLIFVHGGGAHSGWWDHISPFFSGSRRVIAVDLSGHGDSGTRASYDLNTWAREVLAASSTVAPSGSPIIVGHSMGGWVAARAAECCGDRIDSIIVLDSPLRDHAPEQSRLRDRKTRAIGYRSREEIIARFVPVPAQEIALPYVSNHVAIQSVRRTLRGWVWKFDTAVFDTPLIDDNRADQEMMEQTLAQMPCRVGYLRCANGLVPPPMADEIRSIMQLRGPFVELAEAGHHPMLDQPLPLVATLRALLEMWSIT